MTPALLPISHADADALRALGCKYEDLYRPPLVQESEDVLLITPAQIAALQAEIARLKQERDASLNERNLARASLREIIDLTREVLHVVPLTYGSAIWYFDRITSAAKASLYGD